MRGMVKFVRAIPDDVEYLRTLAHKSEAHWGYDKKFMDTFDSKFNITEKFILNNPVYVIWKNFIPVAFWGLDAILKCGNWNIFMFRIGN